MNENFLIFLFGILLLAIAFGLLYLKYRFIFSGGIRCKAKIVDIQEMSSGYVVHGGANVKKNSYIVKIGNKKYYTAHGCIFKALSRRKIGKEILVFKNDNYGREVFKCFDFRIEILAMVFIVAGLILLIYR